eukprot:888571-Prymnesium_polylepis.1
MRRPRRPRFRFCEVETLHAKKRISGYLEPIGGFASCTFLVYTKATSPPARYLLLLTGRARGRGALQRTSHNISMHNYAHAD